MPHSDDLRIPAGEPGWCTAPPAQCGRYAEHGDPEPTNPAAWSVSGIRRTPQAPNDIGAGEENKEEIG